MKTVPPPCPEPETGPKYWRSLDQLADTPEFRQWLEREFPSGAAEFPDGQSRRHFVKIMSASFLLAGLGMTGCRRPEERILPFAKAPEGYIHGVAQHYATAFPTRSSAIPLVVRSQDGRPTKIEGNAIHPGSNGGTDQFAQASILNLYDPDRATRFVKDNKAVSRDEALAGLEALARTAQAGQGAGVAFLLEQGNSPTRERVIAEVSRRLPQAKWFAHEAVDFSVHREVATAVFGKAVAPVYQFDKARIILSLDCDFIGAEEDTYRNVRGFAHGRKVKHEGGVATMNRLYAVEALFSLTGANADHRLRVPASAIVRVAAQLAARILPQSGGGELLASLGRLAGAGGTDEKWIAECASDLIAHKGEVLVVAGYQQPAAVHALAHAMNVALGGLGRTVTLQQARAESHGTIQQLTDALNAGSVDTLVLLGGNPAYTAPADLNWSSAAARAKTIVRLGYYEDESFNPTGWHLPLAHPLESWGDARTGAGTVIPVQPLIAPLFGGLTEIEVLARLGGLAKTNPHELVRETFAAAAGSEENAWRKFLHDGYLAGTAALPMTAEFNWTAAARLVGAAQATPAPSQSALEVVFHRSYSTDDGRFANNGWLQETPDPITKLTWDNAILVSPATAAALGLGKLGKGSLTNEAKKGQFHVPVADVKLGGLTVTGPVWIQPGMADNVLGLALGYGRTKAGRVGTGVGFNAYKLRTTRAPHFAAGATISATGQTHDIACTQEHGAMEGRPIIREANLAQYDKKRDFAKHLDLEAPSHSAHVAKDPTRGNLPKTIYENPRYTGLHQWGMSIDLNACVGCTSCLLACQSENNVPIVGKDQVKKGREMHWLRLDRYYAGDVHDPQYAVQPMLCQHCENAPCENVCPVNATVHDEEGLNLMAYNRCVGTRYCSNNCPYKVRRFNYFDYNRRPLDELYKPPIGKNKDGSWELWRWFNDPDTGTRDKDEWDLMKLARNPNVTVRMRGVMEKCTFCIQRIEEAKINQKVKAGASADVRVPDGTFQTACQQACPADAIVFGDTADPMSRVSILKQQERDYTVLGYLDTRPRTTYLARVRNPNPKMPDYHPNPLSLQEHMDKQHGDPFGEGHGAAAGHGKGGH